MGDLILGGVIGAIITAFGVILNALRLRFVRRGEAQDVVAAFQDELLAATSWVGARLKMDDRSLVAEALRDTGIKIEFPSYSKRHDQLRLVLHPVVIEVLPVVLEPVGVLLMNQLLIGTPTELGDEGLAKWRQDLIAVRKCVRASLRLSQWQRVRNRQDYARSHQTIMIEVGGILRRNQVTDDDQRGSL